MSELTGNEIRKLVASSIAISDDHTPEKWVDYEKRRMRKVSWIYRPYAFHLIYDIVQTKRGERALVGIFEYQWIEYGEKKEWKPILTTSRYKEILFEADQCRPNLI